MAGRLLASPQDAEECVSDTWLAAWGSMPPHRPQALRMFFAKLTRRLAFNRYKANTAEKRGGGQLPLVLEELSECVAGSEDVQQQVEDRELGRLVRDFVHAPAPAGAGSVFAAVLLRRAGKRDRTTLWGSRRTTPR